ncbi:MAG: hypothetical protein AUH44_02380 [Chloroflexi bacterium 13_1_40CM_68_15]|nr:MAG: hypothetical protein AUH44_02380 [Chloroflexi bacterium 13_1_40CM_68_15]
MILSQVGWQMGLLVQLPSGVNTWSHAPTVFFEGLDNVADYRATYGPAETQGRYEVSWGGVSPTGRYKYIAWFMRAGNWNQAGYAELDNQYSDANAVGEASDTIDLTATCIRLSSSSSNLHELGSPVALFLLTNGWYDWTSGFATTGGLDNGRPYSYTNYSAPNYDHLGVGGP